MKGFKEFLEWENLSRFLKENAFKIIIMIVIFKIAKYVKKHIDKVIRVILDKSRIDKSVASFLMSLYSILYYIVLTYVLIDILGISTSSITTFFSAAGIVLGIAFKEIIGNFGGGLIILTFKPFKVGDMIEYNKYEGEVKSIEMFYTKMKTPQNELVIIPNGIITNTELRNMTNEKVRRLDMIVGVSYNSDIKKVKEVLKNKDVACVIIEPIPANMGVIETHKKFLQELRKITEETGTILIFDDVISGFRLALGGAQEFFGITPDLTTLGKIIGGGYPVGAFGGKREIMDLVAPVGRVYHAGTLSGNPIASKAGFATISYLKENPNIYKELAENTNYLVDNIEKLAEKYKVDVCINSMGSLFTIFFVDLEKVENLEDSLKANTENFSIYFNTMLDNGIVVPPSQFEAHFLSIAHTKKELDRTLEVMEMAFKKIGEKNAK